LPPTLPADLAGHRHNLAAAADLLPCVTSATGPDRLPARRSRLIVIILACYDQEIPAFDHTNGVSQTVILKYIP
jgi:hypothetical protein